MIAVAICTHSDFAQGLLNACEMIAGKQENVEAFCFMGDEQIEELYSRISETTNKYEDGCIYVVDLINATPFNACLMCCANTNNVVVSNINMPLMLDLLIKRVSFEGDVRDLVAEIKNNTSDYMMSVTYPEEVFK